jgi:3-oxo-4-pregnene-20-carboxyl-CoA dehydrogenase alpha subunit
MDFTPGESQQAVAGLAAEVLTAADPWKELARAGLLSLGVLDTTTLLTEIGRRAPDLAMKALATLMTGVFPLDRWGSEDVRESFVPGVEAGELILTAAVREVREAPLADEAARILVPVATGVALVDPFSSGTTLTRVPTSSGYPSFLVQLDADQDLVMLGDLDCAADLEQLAAAGACALIDGAVAGALALTRDHVATRRQFGRPLAEFQAV